MLPTDMMTMMLPPDCREGTASVLVEDGLQELDPGAELHDVRDLADDLVLLVIDAVLCTIT